jgi:hypothetical protein
LILRPVGQLLPRKHTFIVSTSCATTCHVVVIRMESKAPDHPRTALMGTVVVVIHMPFVAFNILGCSIKSNSEMLRLEHNGTQLTTHIDMDEATVSSLCLQIGYCADLGIHANVGSNQQSLMRCVPGLHFYAFGIGGVTQCSQLRIPIEHARSQKLRRNIHFNGNVAHIIHQSLWCQCVTFK